MKRAWIWVGETHENGVAPSLGLGKEYLSQCETGAVPSGRSQQLLSLAVGSIC